MILKIYDSLKSDPLITEKVGNKIKTYEYPPTENFNGSFIVIDPLDTPRPSDYADNKWLTEDYLFQIEVWSEDFFDCQSIAKQIREVMWNKFGFYQGSGIDERDKDTGIYRDARRYRGKVYVDA